MTAGDIGPKPGGPTHPVPTGPPKGNNGHALPPITDPRVGAARVQACGAVPVSQSAGVGSLPQLVADLRLLTAKAFALTSRQWDPTTGPQQQDVPLGPDWIDIQMCEVRADLRAALTTLDALRDLLTQRPVCVAPDRPTPGYALTAPPVTVSRGSDPRQVAGASSDPWPRRAEASRMGSGVRPGVGFAMGAAPMGFALPKTPRFRCT